MVYGQTGLDGAACVTATAETPETEPAACQHLCLVVRTVVVHLGKSHLSFVMVVIVAQVSKPQNNATELL